jgi:hypothetical protein
MKSWKLNFLEVSGPLQACSGTALTFYDWQRNGKRSGKVLKDNMKNCRKRCDDMKADKFSEKSLFFLARNKKSEGEELVCFIFQYDAGACISMVQFENL